MKKLLLVLMVVALAAFLFVGCLPVTPAEGEGEGEGEPELCPTLTLSDAVEIGGMPYVKAGKKQTITITFTSATEGVAAYLAPNVKDLPVGIPDTAYELVLTTTDDLVYTATHKFHGDCETGFIYVAYGDPCCPVVCKYPVTVDGDKPYAQIQVKLGTSTCPGKCVVNFKSITETCPTTECCGDACSGLASWAIDVYNADPFDICCEPICAIPVDSGSGILCPIDWTTICLNPDPDPDYDFEGCSVIINDEVAEEDYLVIVTLVDEVGNKTTYYGAIGLVANFAGDCVEVHVWEGTADADDDCCIDTWEYIGYSPDDDPVTIGVDDCTK